MSRLLEKMPHATLQKRIDKLEEVVDELCDMWNETALNLIKRIERLEGVEHEDD